MRKLFNITGFLPFIVVLFINAVVDLGHKITIQNILVKSYSGDILIALTAIVNLLILLPYISLFSLSGFLNDKFSRTQISRVAAAITIIFTFLITIAYFKGWFYFAFFMTLLLAVQSAIFSTAKYALIKQIAKKENIALANSVVESATIIAILLSSLIFSIIFEKFVVIADSPGKMMSSVWFIGIILFIFTCLETYFAFKIPYFEAGDKTSEFKIKKYITFGYLKENLTLIFKNKNILLSVLGVSVFWALAQLIIAVFPRHYKDIIDDNVAIIQIILASSTIGIVFGALFSGYLSKKRVELGIVCISSFGLFIMLVLFASVNSIFLMFLTAILFGFMGGAFIIPLNANIQLNAGKENAGKIMAGSNFIQNIFMVIFLFLAIFCAYFSINSKNIFYLASLSALICSIISFFIVPNLTLRLLVMPFFKLFYKVRVKGDIPQNGGVLMLGNHLSFIDWALIQIAVNRKIKFVMHVSFYEKLHLKWFFNIFDVIRVGKGTNKLAMKQIQTALKNGEVVAMFVEGQITQNSNLNVFKKGYMLAIKDTGAKIVAFHIRGFWGSFFSRADISYKKKTFKRRVLNIAFSQPLDSQISPSNLKKEVIKLSYLNLGDYLNLQKPLQYEWLKWAKRTPFHSSMVDFSTKTLSNFKVLVGVLLFTKKLNLKDEENIGILLPSSNACAIINLTLLTQKKVIVNLNYTSNTNSLENCLENAGIKTILTSKKFIEKLHGRDINFSLKIRQKFFYLEDLKVSKFDKIRAFLKAMLPKILIEKLYFKKANLDDTAAIIYSSGSEGEPKGIVLTHKNLLTNIVQVSDLLGRANIKVMLSSLPVFHSFGLTLTTLYPLYTNLKSVFVADPTDGFTLGTMLQKHKAEVIFGTSTFFRLYTKNKKVTKEMFESIKYAVAGGEKLNLNTKNEFEAKFDKEILEGYGTTETSPVISVNLPNEIKDGKVQIFNKRGSVGMPLNETIVKIVDPDTLKELEDYENGLILVGGHQVMKGYFNKTSDVLVEIDGIKYYKTGDIGYLDQDYFIYITDRISRFAKLGGEMISLSMVENALHEVLCDDDIISVTNLKDDKKGEKIVLLYEGEKSIAKIRELVKNSHLNALMRPSVIHKVEKIPVLGTGKVNFKGVKDLALQLDRQD